MLVAPAPSAAELFGRSQQVTRLTALAHLLRALQIRIKHP